MNYNSEYAVILDMMKYLDDDVVRSLIGFIFNKEQFYNPYDTYKELFLGLLISDNSSVINNKITIDEVLKDKNLYLKDEHKTKYNRYVLLKECFKKDGYITYKNKEFAYNSEFIEKIKNEDLQFMTDLYNDLFLEIFAEKNRKKTGLSSCINQLTNSFYSFKFDIFGYSNIAKLFNQFVELYIKSGKCYIVENRNDNRKRILLKSTIFQANRGYGGYKEENVFQIIENDNKLYLAEYFYDFNSKKEKVPTIFEEIKHYTTIENSNDNKGHALIGAKTVSSYFNSIKSLDIAVEKLQEKIAKQESCHICNPVVKNNKYKKKHMCSNCQKLVNLIIENVKESGGWITQADIVYAIKQKGKEEETCQNTYDIRKLRYKYLRKFLIKLNKDKKLNKTKIEDLVNTIFKEKDGFEKFSF